MISRANVGPWILGFSHEIFFENRKGAKRKKSFIHSSLEKKRKRKRELRRQRRKGKGEERVCTSHRRSSLMAALST